MEKAAHADLPEIASELDSFIEPFKAVVLNHIKTKLPPNRWSNLRRLARRGPFISGLSHNELYKLRHCESPEELLEDGIADDGMSLEDLLTPFSEAGVTVIDNISGQPVYFIEKLGVYTWSLSKEHPAILSLWLTFPAYPPGW